MSLSVDSTVRLVWSSFSSVQTVSGDKNVQTPKRPAFFHDFQRPIGESKEISSHPTAMEKTVPPTVRRVFPMSQVD